MNPQLLIGILVGLVSLVTAAVALARFFTKNQRQFDWLRKELQSLREQNTAIRASVTQYPSISSTSAFQDLTQVMGEAAKALGAEVYSVSVPVSLDAPTHLKIIYSSDTKSTQLQTIEIPIKGSNAGWVFDNQQHYVMNDASTDNRHYNGVDKAIGTPTKAMLTFPLTARGKCHGVVQFLKYQSGIFEEERDIPVTLRFIPTITQKVIELEESPREDIPTIARGDTVKTAVLFTDIRAFSEIASKISLNITVSLLNEYYSSLLPLVLSRRGILQEYIGDGLYVSFTLDSPGASARAAVSCALEMQHVFNDIFQGWQKIHPTSSQNAHCIGIATGSVYSGFIGHPKERREKLVGPVVNLAAHLCEQASAIGGGVLVDQETMALVNTEGHSSKPIEVDRGEKIKCFQVLSNRG